MAAEVTVDPDLVLSILQAAVAAAIYSISVYMKRRKQGDTFDPYKFFATVIVGIVVGIAIFLSTDRTLDAETLAGQIAAYTGMVVLVENILKYLMRSASTGPDDPGDALKGAGNRVSQSPGDNA